ncbi:GNAT family N-acetyltransferase [Fredinandcohnia humi]
MTIKIRTEMEKDYFEIAEIQALAFTYSFGMGEVLLVDALRHRKAYDRELSLVAESNGHIVGHVMFTSIDIMIEGKVQKAVNLAPIAIHPAHQKKGIGALLIEEGHKRCLEKGYDFSILLGDPAYYSRFGYQAGMYGNVATIIERKHIMKRSSDIKIRRVQQADIPVLMEMWDKVYRTDNLAIKPYPSILHWISTSTSVTTAVVEEDDQVIGYLRYHTHNPKQITYFLARDKNAATKLIEHLNQLISDSEDNLALPLHPLSEEVQQLMEYPFKNVIQAWGAGMIKIFNHNNSYINNYCQNVVKDKDKIGLINWPVEFDNC